jgi:hypothetical protein
MWTYFLGFSLGWVQNGQQGVKWTFLQWWGKSMGGGCNVTQCVCVSQQ